MSWKSLSPLLSLDWCKSGRDFGKPSVWALRRTLSPGVGIRKPWCFTPFSRQRAFDVNYVAGRLALLERCNWNNFNFPRCQYSTLCSWFGLPQMGKSVNTSLFPPAYEHKYWRSCCTIKPAGSAKHQDFFRQYLRTTLKSIPFHSGLWLKHDRKEKEHPPADIWIRILQYSDHL